MQFNNQIRIGLLTKDLECAKLVFVEAKDLNIEPSTIPKCPACGQSYWKVFERIDRHANLVRVDGLRDLVVDSRDESTYSQSLLLECVHCEAKYLPQAEVGSKSENIEAWMEQTGLMDWPYTVVNEGQYE